MSVISRTCITWIEKANFMLLSWCCLQTYIHSFIWVSGCHLPRFWKPLRAAKGKESEDLRDSSWALPFLFLLSNWFLSTLKRWEEFIYLWIEVVLFYFSHKGRRRGEKGWEFERAVHVSKGPQASQGNAILRSDGFWALLWSMFACRHYKS